MKRIWFLKRIFVFLASNQFDFLALIKFWNEMAIMIIGYGTTDYCKQLVVVAYLWAIWEVEFFFLILFLYL